MYTYAKVITIILLLLAGSLLHKGITERVPSDVIYSIVYVVLVYINQYVWNDPGKNKRGN